MYDSAGTLIEPDSMKGIVMWRMSGYAALSNAHAGEAVADRYWNQVDNAQATYHQWGLLPVIWMEWK